jgi:hypothetical protein
MDGGGAAAAWDTARGLVAGPEGFASPLPGGGGELG